MSASTSHQRMNAHFQEPTLASTTETIVERPADGEPASPPLISPFTSPESNHFPHPDPVRQPTLKAQSFPLVIPPDNSQAARTIVLCFDGTGDQFDADNSNIVQLVSLLKKNDKNKQMIYYQTGIGTYTSSKTVTPFMSSIQKTLDEMIAWNLDAHVMDGYQFLMQNYNEGDKISIFGFSRGAYTARSLAGMLHKVGLLPADNLQQIPFAYKMFTRVDYIGWEQSSGFKKAFCTDVTIDFLGVWDTVSSIGLSSKWLPFTTSNTSVRTYRHAIALDERRAKFKVNLWSRPAKEESQLDAEANKHLKGSQRSPTSEKDSIPFSSSFPKLPYPSFIKSGGSGRSQEEEEQSGNDKTLDKMEQLYSKRERLTDIEEVWFAGCHCDVGGGSVSNKTRHSLARIPLRWMIRECFKANTGIMFESEGLRGIGLDPATLFPVVLPRPPPKTVTQEHKIRKPPAEPIPVRLHTTLTNKRAAEIYATTPTPFLGSEEEEELYDALSPAYDQLKLKTRWWILEILPLNLRYQNDYDEWVTRYRSNLANPRFIPMQIKNGVRVHRSVKMRMEAQYEYGKKEGKKYEPKACLSVVPTWID